MKSKNTTLRIALGAVGGIIGTAVLFSALTANKKLFPEDEAPLREDPGEFMVETAENAALTKKEQTEVPKIAEMIAANVLHFSYGASGGALYALLRPKAKNPLLEGAALGVASGYNYDTLADDLASVIEETGATDAAIVGFSMGGGEVARYMSRHGGKNVSQAALISSVVPYMLKTEDNPDGTDRATFDQITEGIKQDRPGFFAGFFKDFYGVGLISHPVSDELLEASRNTAMQASLKATLACAEAFATTDFRPDLASFTVPTLIIHGTSDKTVPIDAAGRAAAKGIANSELIEYNGAPHGLFATHKEQSTSDLLAFLSRK